MSREPYVGCIVDQHARHPRLQSILDTGSYYVQRMWSGIQYGSCVYRALPRNPLDFRETRGVD